MKRRLIQWRRESTQWLKHQTALVLIWINARWWKLAIGAFVCTLVSQKDIQFHVGVDNVPMATMTALVNPVQKMNKNPFEYNVVKEKPKVDPFANAEPVLETIPEPMWAYVEEKGKPKAVKMSWNDANLANTYSNLTYNNPSFATKNSNKKLTAKRKKQLAYIKRFSKVAKTEMEKYGIPASITLAQGLLESNVGESKLATRNNNHFGMKCFSRSCKKGHCSNFTDDSHKDFFRKYGSAWESYRAHSKMLGGKRYRHLKKLAKTDYKGWARGLKKAGYATDKLYAEKLIDLIEELDLNQFDI